MSQEDLWNGKLFRSGKKEKGTICPDTMFSKRLSSAKSAKEFSNEKNPSEDFSRPIGNRCELLSSSLSNLPAKQSWKNRTGKLSQTLNNVRTTFGVLSQRIKKSTKKRQALINAESPSSPVTPCAKSRAALGRTPTKLYSPFSIDTPTGKENWSDRFIKDKTRTDNSSSKGEKKKFRRTRLDLGTDVWEIDTNIEEGIFSNESLQAQIGIYEFHSVANRIVQSGSND